MKRKFNAFVSLLLIGTLFFITSCKKEDAQGEDLATIKQGWVTGAWKQTDILLAYAIPSPFGGTLPVGTSLHILAPYLPVSGPKITATNDNVFTFDAKGTYNLSGSIDFMLPNTTNSGTWNLQVYGSALHLMSTDNEDTPLWVDKIDAENLKLGSLSTTVYIAEVDADIPVYFIFEKQ